MATHNLKLLATLVTALKGATAVGYPTSKSIDADTTALDVKVNGMSNVNAKVRDALETFSTDRWTIVQQGEGDIVGVDGTTGSSSFLVISKNPLLENTETILETVNTFRMPFRLGAATTLSQRVAGQEHVLEAVSVLTDPLLAMPVYTPRALAAIQQATTTLTVTTTVAHGLLPGDRISIYGVTSDSRLNYPMATVQATPSPTVFTVVAIPGSAIQSLTIGPFTNQGFVTKSDPCGYSRNAVSLLYDSNSATSASYFVRSEGGSALPSGTLNGNQQISFGNTSASVLATSAGTVAFAPSNMIDFITKIEGVSLSSVAVDNAASTPSLVKRTQVVPNPDRDYKLRLRSKNHRSFTRPVGKITTISKAGSTTATVVTDTAHGLSVGDWIVMYGVRDQTNFANAGTAVQVASVPNTTTITFVHGSSTTASSTGGAIIEVWGQQANSGFIGQVVSTVARTDNILTLVMNATISGMVIGEYINLYGVRNNTGGTDMGVDGAYRIRDIVTSTLVLEPISMVIDGVTTDYSPVGANIATTNAGGAILKRTDYRLHFVRAMDNDKLVVEFSGGGRNDRLEAVPVLLTENSVLVTYGGQSPAVTSGQGGTNRLLGILPGVGAINADRASAAITSNGNSAISDDFGAAVAASIGVASTGGTNPTLDITLEESYDGTNFYPIYQLPRITANGTYPLPPTVIGGRRRWSWVVSGTSPTFTVTINTTRLAIAAINKQFFDRALNVNSLNAVSASYPISGLLQLNARVYLTNLGSGVQPQIALDVSDDGANWTQVAIVTATTTGVLSLYGAQQSASYARFRTAVAGTAAVLGFNCLSGVN